MKIVKPSNMEIKVTSCADCPFRQDHIDWCSQESIYVTAEVRHKKVPPSCTINTQSITVKLESNEQG